MSDKSPTADSTEDPVENETEPLSSVHTENLPGLLADLKCSLMVTTYQAGRIVLLRSDGNVLNTHFREFSRPMGLTERDGRLWIGGAIQIWEFHRSKAIASAIDPKVDACFVPRRTHITGDIQVHEMAATDEDLWVVNTRFSCLCTLDGIHSFVPRWKPPFIDEMSPDDRCHLNGLALRNDQPTYVTALGETSSPRGWRDRKRDGGILLEVSSGEVLVRGLSMPHSPRWHEGNLWLLESGTGSIGIVDLARGRYEPLLRLPGFTRGLSFAGRYAFVGLSQVRETAVFSGLPITELDERASGVWVIDIDAMQVAAFLRFDGSVREIFAVQVIPQIRFPELVVDDPRTLADAFILPS